MSLFPEMQSPEPYRVLARKYRPSGFEALIGQDAVVTTLSNAIASNRLAQAWLLTGVRGIGKTSTARIIAKALNCTGADGQGGPTMHPCGVCDACVGIAAGQHIDVIEMDAASHTGVDDMREVIDSARYASVSARYKIHIIDEVHMLSRNAWNALLKTLEEPPPHVKFIFATTEVQKIPATILSRCQRFDLKRVPADLLQAHFGRIAAAEHVEAESEALALIARAAQGSVRDGLSILDQAIAMGNGRVEAGAVRAMLGLADRNRIADLLGLMLEGDAPGALAAMELAASAGVEPHALFEGLLDMVHAVTRARLAGEADVALSAEDQAAVGRWAAALDYPRIHRLWQMLLKGLQDIHAAPDPAQAADMAVLRIIHAADLPDPGQLARLLTGAPAPATPAIDAPAASSPTGPTDFAGLLALAEAQREAMLVKQLHDDVGCVQFAPGRLVLAQRGLLPGDFARTLAKQLREWTGEPWDVLLDHAADAPSLREQQARARAEAMASAEDDPRIRALIDAFPGAELLDVTQPLRSQA